MGRKHIHKLSACAIVSTCTCDLVGHVNTVKCIFVCCKTDGKLMTYYWPGQPEDVYAPGPYRQYQVANYYGAMPGMMATYPPAVHSDTPKKVSNAVIYIKL